METKFSKANKAQVWSCGGGTQSCAIAALIVQGKLPKPDFSVIADTGRETETTWKYYNETLKPSLALVGVDLVRVEAKEFSYCGTNAFNNSGSLLIPAFSTLENSGKLTNFCTTYWKIDVVERYLSKQGITKSEMCNWIGFSVDEPLRYMRKMQSPLFAEGFFRFPLVEMHVFRRDCQKIITSVGWPTPAPRSRCWMCPNQGDHEWRELKEQSPQEFSLAVQFERDMQIQDPHAWLHKSCIPLDQVDFSQPEDLFSRACDTGRCFV